MGHKQVGDMAEGSPVRYPALWTASAHGRTERVLQLLVGGMQLHDIEERGGARESTPLSEASLQGNFEVLELLLEVGAEICTRDCKGATALHYAAFQGHADVAQLLIDNRANVSATASDGKTPLHFAANQGREKVLMLLLHHGAQLSATDNTGRTVIQCAVDGGHGGVVLPLLHMGGPAVFASKLQRGLQSHLQIR